MNDQTRTARVTGLLYLGLAVFGAIGFLVIRPKVHVPLDAALTVQNVVANELLARIGVAAELGVVITQALAAMWFFKLLRPVNAFAGASVAAFGLINSAAVLGSAICVSTAIASLHRPDQVLLLYDLSAKAWQLGGVFFGLWLIPMGFAAREAKLPRALGFILMIGGVGYVASSVLAVLGAPQMIGDVIVIPASVGEFWMIGYLLIIGWKTPATTSASAAT